MILPSSYTTIRLICLFSVCVDDYVVNDYLYNGKRPHLYCTWGEEFQILLFQLKFSSRYFIVTVSMENILFNNSHFVGTKQTTSLRISWTEQEWHSIKRDNGDALRLDFFLLLNSQVNHKKVAFDCSFRSNSIVCTSNKQFTVEIHKNKWKLWLHSHSLISL